MKRTLTLLVALVFCLPFLSAQTYTVYTPDGEKTLEISTKQILVKFSTGTPITTMSQILGSQSTLLKPFNKELVLTHPEVVLAELQPGIDPSKIAELCSQMESYPEVILANPFVVYEDGQQQGIMDRFLVYLKDPGDYALLKTKAEETGTTILKENEFFKGLFILLADKNSSGNALEMANWFHETGLFAWAETDFLLRGSSFSNPPSVQNTNDTFYDYQWSIENTGSTIQYNGTVDADMDVDLAWNTNTGAPGTRIAIIDDGVDLFHPDLVGNLVGGFDATGFGSNGGSSGNDAHGTSCAGIVAAVGNNNLGVAGVAYDCKIVPVRIAYGSGGNWITTTSWLANGIGWAYNVGNADVLSNSWGGGSPSAMINLAISDAVTFGRNGLGSAVLFSSGNNNSFVGYPASNNNTIAVGAMSMCNQRKSPISCDLETGWGSNFGTNLDVVAPGVKIATTDPVGGWGNSPNDYTGIFNGTSSSCPNAAGVMALIMSEDPTLTLANARFYLESTCAKVGNYTYNSNVSGQPNGTWNSEMGYGCVNANQALAAMNSSGGNLPNLTYVPSTISLNVTGTIVDMDVEVINNGSVSAGSSSTLEYYLIDTSFNNVYSIGTDFVPNLAANASSNESIVVDVATLTSPTIPAGVYYAAFWADAFDVIVESDSTDNGGYLGSPLVIVGPQLNPPVANFIGSPTTVCEGDPVNFNSTSTGTINTYNWSFPGGTPSSFTGQNPPQIIYNNSGTYQVSLTVSNSAGSDTETKNAYITVNNCTPPPTADFFGSPTTLCAGNTVSFTSTSTGTINSYSWSFPGGSPSSSIFPNPTITYSTPGTYQVSLTVSNANGSDTETKVAYITVNNCTPPPVANFFGSPTTICEGDPVNFTNTSTGTITSYSWSFPGGTPSSFSGQNPPQIIYNNSGTYQVSLTVSNANGSDTETKTAYITVNTCTPLPVADFTGSPTTVCVGNTVNFTDNSTGPVSTYSWIFPGGSPNFSSAQTPPAIMYNTPGTYQVSLTVTNATGSDTETKIAYITVNNCTPPPVADFTGSPTTICPGDPVNFFDASTGPISTYSWNFQGGTPASSTAQNPVIIYNSPGVYPVSLTVTNSAGTDTETKTAYITVNNCTPPPVADFIGSPTTICEGDMVNFGNNSTGTIGSYSWSFPGGTPATSNAQTPPSITYPSAGTYPVTLTVTNAGGSDTETKNAYITVLSYPNVSLTPFSAVDENDPPFALTGASPSGGTWSGVGVIGGMFDPSIAGVGSHTLTYIYTNAGGCSDTASQMITVNAASIPPFTFSWTNQSGRLYGQAQISGIPADAGDWIAAFDPNGICSGADPVIMNNGIAYINLTIYGDDATTPSIDEGISPGDYFTLRLFDSSDSVYLEYPTSVAPFQFTQWLNTNGTPMPAYNNISDIYNFLPVAVDTIVLQPGWNLVSTDVVPLDSNVSAVFSGLNAGNLIYVTGFDLGSTFYDPNGPAFLNTLTHLERGFGYWVKVNTLDTLYVVGDPLPPTLKKDLDAGWNLAAYIPQMSEAPANYLSNLITANNLLYVTGFSGGSTIFDPNGPPFLNTLTQMENSYGYWIKVVNAINGDQYKREKDPFGRTLTPVYNFVNGTSSLKQKRAIGELVEIINQAGNIVGGMEILPEGYLMTAVIYGDDPSTEEIEGISMGETLRFRYQDKISTEEIEFSGDMNLIQVNLNFDQIIDYQLYPNPFSNVINLEYRLDNDSEVVAEIYDLSGRKIEIIQEGNQMQGSYHLKWYADQFANGMYLMRLQINGQEVLNERIILNR